MTKWCGNAAAPGGVFAGRGSSAEAEERMRRVILRLYDARAMFILSIMQRI